MESTVDPAVVRAVSLLHSRSPDALRTLYQMLADLCHQPATKVDQWLNGFSKPSFGVKTSVVRTVGQPSIQLSRITDSRSLDPISPVLSAGYADSSKRNVAQPRLFEPDIVRTVERGTIQSHRTSDKAKEALQSRRNSDVLGDIQGECSAHSSPAHSRRSSVKDSSAAESDGSDEDDVILMEKNTSVAANRRKRRVLGDSDSEDDCVIIGQKPAKRLKPQAASSVCKPESLSVEFSEDDDDDELSSPESEQSSTSSQGNSMLALQRHLADRSSKAAGARPGGSFIVDGTDRVFGHNGSSSLNPASKSLSSTATAIAKQVSQTAPRLPSTSSSSRQRMAQMKRQATKISQQVRIRK